MTLQSQASGDGNTMSENLLPCPFCGGESELEQTGKLELTIRCVGPQPSGLRGCGPRYTQKITPHRFTLEWLAEHMAKVWNRRHSITPEQGE